MTLDEAAMVAGLLIGSTTGWNDDSAEMTIGMMAERWNDPRAAREAIDAVIGVWTQSSRPPWGVLHGAYRDAIRRAALSSDLQLRPGAAGGYLDIAEGRKVAVRAYARECARRDPETDPLIKSGFRMNRPSQKIIDGMLGVIGGDDEPFSEDR